jgi:hypothetical protein
MRDPVGKDAMLHRQGHVTRRLRLSPLSHKFIRNDDHGTIGFLNVIITNSTSDDMGTVASNDAHPPSGDGAEISNTNRIPPPTTSVDDTLITLVAPQRRGLGP